MRSERAHCLRTADMEVHCFHASLASKASGSGDVDRVTARGEVDAMAALAPIRLCVPVLSAVTPAVSTRCRPAYWVEYGFELRIPPSVTRLHSV